MNEKFITPLFNTLSYFLTFQGGFNHEKLLGKLENFLEVIWRETKKTKFPAKLAAAAGLTSGLLSTIFSIERFQKNTTFDNFYYLKQKNGLNIIQHLQIHEFPSVSKLMSEKFYNFLSIYGGNVFGDDKLDRIEEFVTATNWLVV